MKLLKFFLSFLVVSLWLSYGAAFAQAQSTVFTADELSKYNGIEDRPAYFAYEGKVYDVTGSPVWKAGQHFGLQAGQDLTGEMEGAPHGVEVFVGLKEVGTFATTVETVPAPKQTTTVVAEAETESPARKWYEGRIRFIGFSVLGWTGILLGISFVGNFATCFALPWTKLPLPWHGTRPGPDALDKAQTRPHWGNLHKYFAWATVGFGVLHGVIGFMQMLGFYL